MDSVPIKPKKHIYFIAISLFALSGCGDFFEKKSTELESRAVIRDISRVRENPHVKNPLPETYLEPPRRLKVEDGVKLFYFTKYQPVGELDYVNPKNLDLQNKINGFGGTVRDLGFNVSTNPSTNQMIIHCADDAECDQVLQYLDKTDVAPIQVHIDCLIMERFGDVTQDWETTLLIENFLGEDITLGEGKFPMPAFPGAALRERRRREFGVDFGYWINQGVPGDQIRVVVDVLESRGYLKILLNPTLETVNGKKATVEIVDTAPIEKIVTERGNLTYTVTDYKDVFDTLSVIPYVYSDGSIGLKTDIRIGSKSKPEGVVQAPIITERSINIGENRIDPGKSLIIGGMRKSENRSVVRGVPFFKDLPLVGILFSSKDYEENATEIVFILTPSISHGGVEYQEMADMVREKFEGPDSGTDIDDIITDPLRTKAYSDVVEKEADQSETEMVRLQVEAADIKRQALSEQLRAEHALAELETLRVTAHEAQAKIERANAKKKVAEAEQEAIAKESQAQQAIVTKTKAEIEKAQSQASSSRAKADAAKSELEQAELQVQKYIEQEKKAREKTRKIQEQIDALEEQPLIEKESHSDSDSNNPQEDGK